MQFKFLDDGALEAHYQELKDKVSEKPKNAKYRARLACVLAEKDNRVLKNNGSSTTPTIHKEAIALAEHAVTLAPEKPYGYAALSWLYPRLEERMEALQRAVELTSSTKEHVFAKVGLLVRLLIEPREEEIRKVRGVVGSANAHHPSRRRLKEPQETLLYDRIRQALDDAWDSIPSNENQIDFLTRHEYRMGLFFRKMEPSSIYKLKAHHHFFQVCGNNVPESHSLRRTAAFWLGTMGIIVHGGNNDNNNNNNNNIVVVDKCPPEYIVGLYSTFAARFDTLLVDTLEYKTPSKLRQLFDGVWKNKQQPTTNHKRRGADLGCGTGLSGLAFRDCVDELYGVDLSPQMIEKARLRPNCYQNLLVGDVLSIFEEQDDTTTTPLLFDLVIACDVFVYLGELRPVFEKVYTFLIQTNGYFAFSTELLVSSTQTTHQQQSYVLQGCARFAHSKAYIEQLAHDIGFHICVLTSCPIRKNEGKDVIGLLAVFRKQ